MEISVLKSRHIVYEKNYFTTQTENVKLKLLSAASASTKRE